MRQFTRCSHCRQWYLPSATTTVELLCHGGTVRRLATWCLRCVAEAEKRSRTLNALPDSTPMPPVAPTTTASLPPDLHQLLEQHTQLMEQALHEDEATLLPRIHDLIRWCRQQQEHVTHPEHRQRVQRTLQYWEAFLALLARPPD